MVHQEKMINLPVYREGVETKQVLNPLKLSVLVAHFYF